MSTRFSGGATRKLLSERGAPPTLIVDAGRVLMASIVLTIPDAQLPRVRAALCNNAGLADSNPNAKEAVILLIKAVVQAVEYNEAARAANAAIVIGTVDGIVT